MALENRDTVLGLTTGFYLDPNYQPKAFQFESKMFDKKEISVNDKIYSLENICPDLELDSELFSRVLVLYTGGTIGMKNFDGALAPFANYMEQSLRKLPMFHEPDVANEFGISNELGHPLIMPLSKQGRHVIYSVLEYDPLLDSSNMTMTDWARLAHDIKIHYNHYDAFIILHGTDTMAYTASALSFMLENLGKSVIVTGSQIPLYETRSDGRDNFLGALVMAGHYVIPEVSVFFNNQLMRGNRTIKKDCGSFDAFDSPNLAPLAVLEINIMVNWNAMFKPTSLAKMDVHTNVCPNVGLLRFFPSITTENVKHFLQPPMQGVVLQTYGAGNGPHSRKDLLSLFREAAARGVLILNITQCARGLVSAAYAAGKALLDYGIIPGSDMTPEAALTKLAYVLGKTEWSLGTKRKMLGVNLRGEMTVMDTGHQSKCLLDIPLISKMKECMRLSSQDEVALLRSSVYPPLACQAAKEADIEALDKLKESGAVFSTQNYDGRTALHVAASEGHTELVRYLLTNGALVHCRDRYGSNALDDAIKFNKHEVIRLLVQTGARLSLRSYKLGIELCLAAAKGEVESLKSFKLAEANLNQGDYCGRTALHVAVAHGNIEAVQFLVDSGANVNAMDHFDQTPLNEAQKLNRQDIASIINNITN